MIFVLLTYSYIIVFAVLQNCWSNKSSHTQRKRESSANILFLTVKNKTINYTTWAYTITFSLTPNMDFSGWVWLLNHKYNPQ